MKKVLIVIGMCVIISSLAPLMLSLLRPVQIDWLVISMFFVIGLVVLVVGFFTSKKKEKE